MEWEMTKVIIFILEAKIFQQHNRPIDLSLRIWDSLEITALISICFRLFFLQVLVSKKILTSLEIWLVSSSGGGPKVCFLSLIFLSHQMCQTSKPWTSQQFECLLNLSIPSTISSILISPLLSCRMLNILQTDEFRASMSRNNTALEYLQLK